MASDKFVLLLVLLVNVICTIVVFSMCPAFLITEFQGSLHYYQKSFCVPETRIWQKNHMYSRKQMNYKYLKIKYQTSIDISIVTCKLDNSVI